MSKVVFDQENENITDLEEKLVQKFESRIKQGFLRLIMLHLIKQGKADNGFQLMALIKEHTDGRWEPGPNRIYPILQEFESAGWITIKENPYKKRQRKKIIMTDKGRKAATKRIKITREVLEPWQNIITRVPDYDDTNPEISSNE